MERRTTPYACHVFVCVNDRGGRAKSCADGVGMALKDALKAGVAARGWKGRVRVSHTGCMGLCAHGPNVLLQPDGCWFDAVQPGDLPAILEEVARRHPELAAGSA